MVTQESRINTTEQNKSHQCLAYADDVTVLAITRKEMKNVTKRLEWEAGKVELRINGSKSKYMYMRKVSGKGNDWELEIVLEGKRTMKIEKVQNITYLGVWFSEDGDNAAEVSARIVKADCCAGAMNKILKSKSVSNKAKIKLYKKGQRFVTSAKYG
ncbi:reverse transcriptase (rna-dependent dna polymerase) [Holotrichia oblita]|uniref:Reverse transcriptase (Rna-dependent dna polymerase) n=1 Tax=Holotrichia oblita TaxID=644536 RepID=A0ACB9TF11_HOLOL|nr:reverse transcriptase (rna-dependent dna polymerase) [Holotrichia oblita]